MSTLRERSHSLVPPFDRNIHDRSIPHLGLIADGTRRWAEMHGVSLSEAYLKAVGKIEELSDVVFGQDTRALSVYLLSVKNLRRDSASLELIFNAETYMMEFLLPRIAMQWQCKMVHAGDPKLLPKPFALILRKLCEATSHFRNRVMYLCAAYDPILEFEHACNLSKGDGQSFTSHLWVPNALDLVVRTGGERRLSNFLPLQSGYSEFYFCDKLFPDFTASDLKDAYTNFHSRQRRHGV